MYVLAGRGGEAKKKFAIYSIHIIVIFMNKAFKRVVDVWDWPLQSHFVKSEEDKKSLRRASDMGSAFAAVAVYTPLVTLTPYFQSHGTAMATAAFMVLAGFYTGSATWKLNRHRQHTL